jgi:hypothetical protein
MAVRRLERATLVVAFVVVCAVHAPLIGYKSFANVDEAYAAAIGERLLEGFKLYQGAISQRGPLMYYAFEALGRLHGWDNIPALRCWALAFSLAHVYGVWCLGRALLSREATVVATMFTAYALCFGFPPTDGYALHGETLQLPAMLAATLVGALAMRRPPGAARRGGLAGAGLAYGVAASIKQSVLLHPLSLCLWLLVDVHRRRSGMRAFAADLAVLAAGSAAVPALFVANAAREGTLRNLFYYTFTYNSQVHLRPAPSQTYPWLPNLFFRLSDGTSFFILTALLFACAGPWVARRARAAWRERSLWPLGRGFGVVRFLAINFAIALASAASMYRFFPHYFIAAWPFAALCAGAALSPLFRSARWGSGARRMGWGFLSFVLFSGWLGTVFGEKVDGRVAHDRTVDDVAKFIRATTSTDDRIFVWGFSPWVYEYAGRRPAGRYVFETYVTGMVPWFWEKRSVEMARVVPGSVEGLLDDLEREKPAVVVDAGSIMMARPMRAYEPFARFLHQGYCFEIRFGGFDVYRRKADGLACVVPYFPRPFDAIDWMGHGLPVPIPRLADEDLTRPLPRANYFKPVWFRSQPRPAGLEAVRDRRRENEEAEAAADGYRIEDIEDDGTAE